MKTTKTLLFTAIWLCSSLYLQAQNFSDLFKAGAQDINTVANGYLRPFGNSFTTGLGSNWYNTAEVHKLLGFDLTLGVTGVFTPSSDQTFDLTTLKLLTAPNGETTAPTFAGSGKGTNLELTDNGRRIVSFTTPKGFSKIMPVPSLQLTIGLPIINDISLRFSPKVISNGVETSMWGLGVKHDFKRWIPALKLLPFDAAAQVGYTQFNIQYNIPTSNIITPDLLVDPGITLVNQTNIQYDPNTTGATDIYNGQNLHLNSKALSGALIVSKKLLFFTPYVGLGFTKTNYELAMAGTYPILTNVFEADANGNVTKMGYEEKSDPINISDGQTMMNATVGFRMKILWVMALHAQYVFQKYPTATVGFGINIR